MGLRATVGGEHLEIDAIRDDVVRIRMSRGGRFDERPTFAVVAEPLPVEVRTEVGPDSATLTTSALVVRLGLAPFALTVERTDGSPVLRVASGDDGSPWTYATLNDAWLSRRTLGDGQVYGLGERTGWVRPPWPGAGELEHRRARPAPDGGVHRRATRRTTRARTGPPRRSTRTTSASRSGTTATPRRAPRRARSSTTPTGRRSTSRVRAATSRSRSTAASGAST